MNSAVAIELHFEYYYSELLNVIIILYRIIIQFYVIHHQMVYCVYVVIMCYINTLIASKWDRYRGTVWM